MKNAVIYARYSSHGQNEQTIDGQIRVCKEFAEKLHLNVINIYSDKHKTGTDVNRPAFQKMISDAKTQTFDCIIVYMLDRFARNRYYSTMYNGMLERLGIQVISATENISESEEGEFYKMFLEWNAERYSKRLGRRVGEGITTSVANGTYTGGRIILGYKVENKKVFIDSDNVDTVKYIFEAYAKGVSKQDIASELNEKGCLIKGRKFKAKDFDKMLLNKKYTGTYTLGNRVCDHTFPRIIDDATFNKVQERLKLNKHFSGANSAKLDYLLQGKIYCGMCGSSIVADGGTGKSGRQYHYYACNGKKKKHICNKKNERKDFLEWYITEQTVNYLSNKERVDIIANDVVKYYESKTSARQIKKLMKDQAKIQQEIDNAVNAIVNTSNAVTHKMLDKKIAELSILLNDLQLQQAELELEQTLQITEKDIVDFISNFIKGDPHDVNFQKRIIDNLVNAVYLYDESTIIFFNVDNGSEVSYIGKNDVDDAINDLGKGVQSLSPMVNQLKTTNSMVVFLLFRVNV